MKKLDRNTKNIWINQIHKEIIIIKKKWPLKYFLHIKHIIRKGGGFFCFFFYGGFCLEAYILGPMKKYLYTYQSVQVCHMLDFLIDSISATFGGAVFQQFGIPLGTNCAPCLVDLFLYSYETEFLQNCFCKLFFYADLTLDLPIMTQKHANAI